MSRILIMIALTAFVSACGAQASAGDSEQLKRRIASAKNGAIIEIPAGDYDLTDLKISRSVTLRGDANGGTVFRSAETTEKGILVPLTGVDLQVENIAFSGAKSWDRNGAGIRHEGRNLTVSNCRFIGNEDGILATGDARGVIRILNSEFVDSGFGDGQSHGIYVSSGGRLEVTQSRFVGTRIGHHIKSLADQTVVEDTMMDDAYGRSSYAIDVSKGGDVMIRNNKFIQSADADNYTIINYDLTRGGAATRLVVTGNEITNRFDGGVLLRNETKLAPVMNANTIVNEGKRPLALVAPGSPAPVKP
ncbi:MAG: right-handed parallel beta-helix repeat-containing protein [Parvularculaceae bacterium]